MTDPEHEDQPTLPPAEGEVTIDKGILRAVLDACTGTLDFGSGFLVDEEVLALRAAATLIGLDPNLVTPSNFICQYDPPHLWQYGMGWGKPRWSCPRCSTTSDTMPEGWEIPEGWVPLEPDPPRPPGPGLMSTSVTLLRTSAPEGNWWWLSFADPTLPGGSQFLGVAIVMTESAEPSQAPVVARLLGLNPGGQVMIFPIEPDYLPGPDWRHRLLSRTEAGLAERSLYGPFDFAVSRPSVPKG